MVLTKACSMLSWEGKWLLVPCVGELHRRDSATTSQTALCGGQSKHSLQASDFFFCKFDVCLSVHRSISVEKKTN